MDDQQQQTPDETPGPRGSGSTLAPGSAVLLRSFASDEECVGNTTRAATLRRIADHVDLLGNAVSEEIRLREVLEDLRNSFHTNRPLVARITEALSYRPNRPR